MSGPLRALCGGLCKVLSGLLALCTTCAAFGLELQGDFVQGGLLRGQLAEGEQVYLGEQILQLDSDGRFIIALDRDAAPELELQWHAIKQGVRRVETLAYSIAARDYDVQRIEGVAQKFVAPNPEQVARSRREARMVGKARRQQRAQNDFFAGFIWPATGPITGVFGSQRVYNGEPRRPHYGVDVAQPAGTPVVAPASGLVTLAEPDLYFSGGTLIIDHGHGLSSTFLHLSKLLVEVGQPVQQGELVAEIGASGRVTGAHLDWRMNWTGAGGNVRLDPQLLVRPMAEVLEAQALLLDRQAQARAKPVEAQGALDSHLQAE
ncbi:MAG: M23 family metallopeptidase [Pseudomonadales bacterium]